jgi:hypothetical protein
MRLTRQKLSRGEAQNLYIPNLQYINRFFVYTKTIYLIKSFQILDENIEII